MTRTMPTLRVGPLDRTQMIVNHQRSRASYASCTREQVSPFRLGTRGISARSTTERSALQSCCSLSVRCVCVCVRLIDWQRDWGEMNLAVTWAGCVNTAGCQRLQQRTRVNEAERTEMLSRVSLDAWLRHVCAVERPFCSSELMFAAPGELREALA